MSSFQGCVEEDGGWRATCLLPTPSLMVDRDEREGKIVKKDVSSCICRGHDAWLAFGCASACCCTNDVLSNMDTSIKFHPLGTAMVVCLMDSTGVMAGNCREGCDAGNGKAERLNMSDWLALLRLADCCLQFAGSLLSYQESRHCPTHPPAKVDWPEPVERGSGLERA
jgi:hypothetical protein